MFQPSPWRADFPAIAALQRQHQTYLDSAATTQKPQALLDALSHYYSHGAANVHRAQHLPGALATQGVVFRWLCFRRSITVGCYVSSDLSKCWSFMGCSSCVPLFRDPALY